MLKLDPYSDGLLFQCDRCQNVGELIIQGIEEEGHYYCWNCLSEMKQQARNESEALDGKIAAK